MHVHVTDERVYSGWIYFYNDNNDFIGDSKNFISNESISNIINEGKAIHKQGEINNVIIAEQEMAIYNNYKFDDIVSCIVILVDGFQYERDSKNVYDSCSFSKRVFF